MPVLCPRQPGSLYHQKLNARKQNLPPLQLFNLKADRGGRDNLINEHPDRVASLLRRPSAEVTQGRGSPGEPIANDREVTFLPKEIALPVSE